MKFSSIALFATGALAVKPIYREPTLVERQSASTIDSDIAAISSAAAALDSSINSFSGASDSAALISASEAVVTAINKGTSDAKAISDLSQADALALVTPIQNLGDEVTTAVKDLIAKKSQFAALGLCGQVLSQVQSQQTAATAFQSALIAKVPAALQPTAQSLAAPITSELSDAANAFQSCPASSVSASSVSSTATGMTSSSTGTATSVTATASGSFTSTCTTSTAVVPTSTGVMPTAPTNGTSPTVSTPGMPTSTIIPSNSGVKQVAGFGGLVLAAVAAIAAF